MKKVKTLQDVSVALQEATKALAEIECRALYTNPPELSFEQKIIYAVKGLDEGEPLQDYLSMDDIEKAIKILADVYVVTGVNLPQDVY